MLKIAIESTNEVVINSFYGLKSTKQGSEPY